MTLNLDTRQRAMLAEMGVRVWLPQSLEPVELPQVEVASQEASSSPAPQPVRSQTAAQALEPVLAQFQALEGVAEMDWPALQASVAECRACGLCNSRKNTVFGAGVAANATPQAVDWMIVGEVPAAAEDEQATPFVGDAGVLLDNMLRACGLSRTPDAGKESGREKGRVFVTNVLKCTTPGNRNPKPEELAQCLPYLQRQIALVQPKIIVAMGRLAANALLQATVSDVQSLPLGKLRGQVHRYNNTPVVVTYHPAYVMRNLPEKGKVWADLCLAMAHLQAH